MKLEGNCMTTAMGIMPHTDVDRALELSLSLDIPCWPQLPRVSFYEDMYAQVSENFPGIILDTEKREVRFSTERFYEELEDLFNHWEEEEYFQLTSRYSMVFHRDCVAGTALPGSQKYSLGPHFACFLIRECS